MKKRINITIDEDIYNQSKLVIRNLSKFLETCLIRKLNSIRVKEEYEINKTQREIAKHINDDRLRVNDIALQNLLSEIGDN